MKNIFTSHVGQKAVSWEANPGRIIQILRRRDQEQLCL